MPAEWELHEATWIAWPHNPETWPGQDMALIESIYTQMISALSQGESIRLLVNDNTMQTHTAQTLESASVDMDQIFFHQIPTNDTWIRDFGPNFIVRDTESGGCEIAANLWEFDSWGGKYESDLDGSASRKIAEEVNIRSFSPGIVLEGGAIEVNGMGSCITTEQCLLNPNRNQGLSKDDMERYLEDHLNVSNVIWCQGELEGDDTDGHIDNLVRFVNSTTIFCAEEQNTSDPNHNCMKQNLEILKKAKDSQGKDFEVVLLPSPGKIGGEANRLPASYANFYIGNHVVLAPIFDQPNDSKAIALLERYFPDRQVVPIVCTPLLYGLGGPHCVTQPQPVHFDF